MADAKTQRKAPAAKAATKTKAKAAGTAKKSTAAKKPAAAKKATATAKKSAARKTAPAKKAASSGKARAKRPRAVDRTTEASEEILKSLQSGQRAAIDAVRKFVDTVDEMLPALERPKKRQEVVDAAMEMADKLVHTQYDFLRSVVQSASKVIDGPHKK